MTFTGYTLEQLQNAHDDAHSALLAVTHLLIAGPFVKEALDLSRPWVGSANQRYHFLTDRYRFLEDQLHTLPNRLEVRLRPDGTVSVNGMATQEQLQEVFHTLGRRIP